MQRIITFETLISIKTMKTICTYFNIVLVSNPKIIIDFPGFQTQTQKLPFSGKLKQAQFQKKFLK